MSLAFKAIENLVFHSNTNPIYSFHKYIFYTCVKYINYDNTIQVACVKGYYKSIDPNVFYCSVSKFLDQEQTLLQRFNGVLYDIHQPPKLEVRFTT